MLDKFIDYLKFEKRYSKHTITAYTKDLSQFYAFIESHKIKPEAANHSLIRSWMVELIEGGVSNRSVNRKLASLRTYYKFILKQGVRNDNPMLKVTAPKMKKSLPSFVEHSAMDKMQVNHEEIFSEDYAGQRDRLIVELFYQTGMRLSELIGIRTQDLKQDTILVTGKRNKQRMVPISHELKQQISRYLVLKEEQGWKNKEELILTNRGEKLYQKFVYRTVNNYLGKVTSVTKRSPHVLRHTFATHMLNNGASLDAIKEILGHANLAATQVYTHNTITKLKQVHQRAHPRGA